MGTNRGASQFILQLQHTDNPQNICEGITFLHQEHGNFFTATLKCICNDSFTDVLGCSEGCQ